MSDTTGTVSTSSNTWPLIAALANNVCVILSVIDAALAYAHGESIAPKLIIGILFFTAATSFLLEAYCPAHTCSKASDETDSKEK